MVFCEFECDNCPTKIGKTPLQGTLNHGKNKRMDHQSVGHHQKRQNRCGHSPNQSSPQRQRPEPTKSRHDSRRPDGQTQKRRSRGE